MAPAVSRVRALDKAPSVACDHAAG